MAHSPFDPSFVVDISEVWEQKEAAVACYRSQFSSDGGGPATAVSGGGFLELLEVRARWFGAMIGGRHGEPYLSRGPVPLPGLPGARGGKRRGAAGVLDVVTVAECWRPAEVLWS